MLKEDDRQIREQLKDMLNPSMRIDYLRILNRLPPDTLVSRLFDEIEETTGDRLSDFIDTPDPGTMVLPLDRIIALRQDLERPFGRGLVRVDPVWVRDDSPVPLFQGKIKHLPPAEDGTPQAAAFLQVNMTSLRQIMRDTWPRESDLPLDVPPGALLVLAKTANALWKRVSESSQNHSRRFLTIAEQESLKRNGQPPRFFRHKDKAIGYWTRFNEEPTTLKIEKAYAEHYEMLFSILSLILSEPAGDENNFPALAELLNTTAEIGGQTLTYREIAALTLADLDEAPDNRMLVPHTALSGAPSDPYISASTRFEPGKTINDALRVYVSLDFNPQSNVYKNSTPYMLKASELDLMMITLAAVQAQVFIDEAYINWGVDGLIGLLEFAEIADKANGRRCRGLC